MALMKSEKESGHIKDNCCLQFLKIKTKISDVNVIINFDILALFFHRYAHRMRKVLIKGDVSL